MKCKRDTSFLLVPVIFTMVFLLVTCLSLFASGAEEEKEKKGLPERGIAVSPEYTGIVISQKEDNVNVDSNVANREGKGNAGIVRHKKSI